MYPMTRCPDSRIVACALRLPMPGGTVTRLFSNRDASDRSPLTVAAPCGLCTHFPMSSGKRQLCAEYSTLPVTRAFA